VSMTVSTENATPPKSSKSRNTHSPVQIQTKPNLNLKFVAQDMEESEFPDLVGSDACDVLQWKLSYLFADTDVHAYPSKICDKYRVAKTHRIPYLYRSFSAKEPYI